MHSHRHIRPAWWVTVSVLAVTLYCVAVPIDAVLYDVPVALAFLIAALVCGSLPLALYRPGLAITAFAMGLIGFAIFSEPEGPIMWPWPVPVTAMIALALLVGLLAYHHRWNLAPIGWLVALGVAFTAPTLAGLRFSATLESTGMMANLIVTFSLAAVGGVFGFLLAGRATVRAQLAQEKEISAEEQARRQLVEERARIARELHDVVAHSMSIIQVQASTARYRLPELEDAAYAEFDDIAGTARDALGEMRRLLGTLRTDDHTAERMPQQTIGDIPRLVESSRRAGASIELNLDDQTRDAPLSVQVVVFRLVQESISNAVRHAPGAHIAVTVAVAVPGMLTVTVANAASNVHTSDATGGGHGIIGMRERTAMLGGRLNLHSTPDGGWIVHAELPCDAAGSALTERTS